MSTWHTSSPPKAQLTLLTPTASNLGSALEGNPMVGTLTTDGTGIVTDDGREIHYYHTRNGVRFARVVDAHGFIIWLQEVL